MHQVRSDIITEHRWINAHQSYQVAGRWCSGAPSIYDSEIIGTGLPLSGQHRPHTSDTAYWGERPTVCSSKKVPLLFHWFSFLIFSFLFNCSCPNQWYTNSWKFFTLINFEDLCAPKDRLLPLGRLMIVRGDDVMKWHERDGWTPKWYSPSIATGQRSQYVVKDFSSRHFIKICSTTLDCYGKLSEKVGFEYLSYLRCFLPLVLILLESSQFYKCRRDRRMSVT